MIRRGITRTLEGLAAVLLLALMTVTGLDVVGRYLLNAPLAGAFELTELMLGALVFAALPLVSARRGHVEVDLLVAVLPDRATRALGLLAASASALVLAFFAWRLGALALDQWQEGSRSVSLGVPFWPFAAFGGLACLMAAVFGLLRASEE